MRFQRNPYLGDRLLLYYVLNISQLPLTILQPAHAEVLDGPVLCPNLLRMIISHPGGVVWLHTRVLVKHEKRAGYLLDNMLEQQ